MKIRARRREKDEEKVSRYIHVLRYAIQNEIGMMTVRIVNDVYNITLKAEEKLVRKHSQRSRGKSPNIGKGVAHDKTQNPKGEDEKTHSHSKRGGISNGKQPGGGNSFSRGRGRSIGGEIRFYTYGKP
jgi:hypothetical protein